ncbi:MAG: protein-disulfide reductase DsbD domain-containing protein, partial [Pseudobdellovibrionaceae bacterium]
MKKTNSHFLFKFLFSTLFAFLLPRPLAWAQGAEDNPDPLLTEPSLSLYEWNPGQSGELNIKLKLPQGYHAYEDMFRLTLLEPDGFKISDFKLKPVHEFYDKFTKKTRRGV